MRLNSIPPDSKWSKHLVRVPGARAAEHGSEAGSALFAAVAAAAAAAAAATARTLSALASAASARIATQQLLVIDGSSETRVPVRALVEVGRRFGRGGLIAVSL